MQFKLTVDDYIYNVDSQKKRNSVTSRCSSDFESIISILDRGSSFCVKVVKVTWLKTIGIRDETLPRPHLSLALSSRWIPLLEVVRPTDLVTVDTLLETVQAQPWRDKLMPALRGPTKTSPPWPMALTLYSDSYSCTLLVHSRSVVAEPVTCTLLNR